MTNFRNPGDIQSLVALALQPALVNEFGYNAQIARVAVALVADGVTDRRIRNAIGSAGVGADIITAATNIRTYA